MGAMASQITSLTIVYSTVYWGADQRKYQSSALLAFVRGIHQWLVNSPHKGPVTWKMFPFDDIIMNPILLKCHRSQWPWRIWVKWSLSTNYVHNSCILYIYTLCIYHNVIDRDIVYWWKFAKPLYDQFLIDNIIITWYDWIEVSNFGCFHPRKL